MKIIWGQRLGREECPYMRRWVLDFKLFSLRLHHWRYSDDQRNYHDHPWWFLTFVLKGGYTDISPVNQDPNSEDRIEQKMSFGSVKFRPADWKHTVQVNSGGCWTFLITGPEFKDWGFWAKRREGSKVKKFMKRNKYFYEYGNHPCETK